MSEKFVGMVESVSKEKRPFTKAEDLKIAELHKQKKTVSEIAQVVKRTPFSVRARILNVLRLMKSVDEYDYKRGRLLISKEEKAARLEEIRKQS